MTVAELVQDLLVSLEDGDDLRAEYQEILGAIREHQFIPDLHQESNQAFAGCLETSLGIHVDAHLQRWIRAIIVELPAFRTQIEQKKILRSTLQEVRGYENFFSHQAWADGLIQPMKHEHAAGGWPFHYTDCFEHAVSFSSNIVDKHVNGIFRTFFLEQGGPTLSGASADKRQLQLKAKYYCFLRTHNVAPRMLEDIREVQVKSKRRRRKLGWTDLHQSVFAGNVGDVTTAVWFGEDPGAKDNGGADLELTEKGFRDAEVQELKRTQRSPTDWNALLMDALNDKPSKTAAEMQELDNRSEIKEKLAWQCYQDHSTKRKRFY